MLYAWPCPFCDKCIHARSLDIATCLALAAPVIEAHMAEHVDEMAAESEAVA